MTISILVSCRLNFVCVLEFTSRFILIPALALAGLTKDIEARVHRGDDCHAVRVLDIHIISSFQLLLVLFLNVWRSFQIFLF